MDEEMKIDETTKDPTIKPLPVDEEVDTTIHEKVNLLTLHDDIVLNSTVMLYDEEFGQEYGIIHIVVNKDVGCDDLDKLIASDEKMMQAKYEIVSLDLCKDMNGDVVVEGKMSRVQEIEVIEIFDFHIIVCLDGGISN